MKHYVGRIARLQYKSTQQYDRICYVRRRLDSKSHTQLLAFTAWKWFRRTVHRRLNNHSSTKIIKTLIISKCITIFVIVAALGSTGILL